MQRKQFSKQQETEKKRSTNSIKRSYQHFHRPYYCYYLNIYKKENYRPFNKVLITIVEYEINKVIERGML